MSIRKKAYEKYRLHWMIQHGYSLSDLMDALAEHQYNDPEDTDLISEPVNKIFENWEFEDGFNGSLWGCLEEFLDAEYRDTTYMKHLLTDEEFSVYLADTSIGKVFTEILRIPRTKLEYIDKLLNEEPACSEDCFGEDVSISETVRFEDGAEIRVMCRGVQYVEGQSNTAWTQAVLYVNGVEVACTDPASGFDGEWTFTNDDTGTVYTAVIVAEDSSPEPSGRKEGRNTCEVSSEISWGKMEY